MFFNSSSSRIETRVFPMKIRDGSGIITSIYGIFFIPLFLLSQNFLQLSLIYLEKYSDNLIIWLLYFCFVILLGGILVLISMSVLGGLAFFFIGF